MNGSNGHKPNHPILGQNCKRDRMIEIQKRLKSAENQKALRLLAEAASYCDAQKIMREIINKKIEIEKANGNNS